MTSAPSIEGLSDLVEIGRGGFGVVYKAAETAFDRVVAVKVLPATGNEKARVRFERERRAMGALSGHPNIVTVYNAGFAERDQPYLVMEYLPRGSLQDRLDGFGPLSVEDALDLGVQMSGALATSHAAGVLHRDVKPANIFVSALGAPKLGDFGIARLRDGTETRSAAVTASVSHAPPEVVAGKRPDEKSDVYSLASTLFEMVVGRAPFYVEGDSTLVAMLSRIANDEIPTYELGPEGAAFGRELGRAMSKDSGGRPTGEQFGRALQDLQRSSGFAVTALSLPENRPPMVGQVGSTQRLETAPLQQAEPSVRKRTSANLMAAAVVAGTLLLGIAAWVIIGGDDGPQQLATGSSTVPVATVPSTSTPPATAGPALTTPTAPTTPTTVTSPSTTRPALDIELPASTSTTAPSGARAPLSFVRQTHSSGAITLSVPSHWVDESVTELREDTNEATRSVAETQGTIGSAFGASVNELGTVAGRDYEKSGIYIEVSRKGLNDLDEVLDDFAANDAESPTVWDGCEVGERRTLEVQGAPMRSQQFLNCDGAFTAGFAMVQQHPDDPELLVSLTLQVAEAWEIAEPTLSVTMLETLLIDADLVPAAGTPLD